MFASFKDLPPQIAAQKTEELLNSRNALRPHLLSQREGVQASPLFSPSSLEDHFGKHPDGIHTAKELLELQAAKAKA